jgi:hypothetical protein
MRTYRINHNEFRSSLAIEAPVDKVLEMFIDPCQLKNWFVQDIQFTDKSSGEYTCTWDGGKIQTGVFNFYKKEKKFCFNMDNIQCEVIVKKRNQGSLIVSRLTNLYFEFDLIKLLNYNCYWTFYLTNLKTFTEFGIDLREQDECIRTEESNTRKTYKREEPASLKK